MNLYEERYNELLREFEQVEAINDNLIRKLENKEEEMKEMRDLCEELNRDLKEKESTISRAAKVIDTLRAELERAKINIEGLEMINERIMHEKKDVERELNDLQRSLQNVDVLMKSESRAKQRTEKFKQQLETQALDFEAREKEMLRRIKELQADVQRAEIRLDEVTSENIQLKEQYKEKDVAFCTTASKIADLEEAIDKVLYEKLLLTDNQELAKEIVEKEKNFQKDIDVIKKEAENQLRFYQNTKSSNHSTIRVLQDKENFESFTERESPKRLQDRGLQTHRDSRVLTPTPSKTNTQKIVGLNRTLTKKDQSTKRKYGNKETPTKRASPTKRVKETLETETELITLPDELDKKVETVMSREIMKQQLVESVEQTNRLVEGIDNYINREAKHVNKLVKDVFEHEVGLRAEVERWMMRNEETEQRLFDYAQKTRIMSIMLADCQTAVQLTVEQREAEKKLAEILEKEYDSALEYLRIENIEKDRFIRTLLEGTQDSAFDTINRDMLKIESLHNQLKESVINNRALEDEHHDLRNRHEYLQGKHEDLLANYIQLKDNFLHLEDILGFNFNLQCTGQRRYEDSLIEDETSVPIGIEAISQKIALLQKIEQEYHKQNSEFEAEREKLISEISRLQKENREHEAVRKVHDQEKMEIEEQIQSFEESVRDMSKNLDDANERVKHLNQENQVLKEEIQKVGALAGGYRREVESFSQRLEVLKNDRNSVTLLADSRLENINQLERFIHDSEEKHRENTVGLENDNSYLNQKLIKLEEENKLFSRREMDLERYANDLKAEKSRIASLLEQTVSDYEVVQRKLKAQESQIENLERENSILTNDNYELRVLSRHHIPRSAEKEDQNDEFNRTRSDPRHTRYISGNLDKDIVRNERSINGAEFGDLRYVLENERANYSKNLINIRRALTKLDSELDMKLQDSAISEAVYASRTTDTFRKSNDDTDVLRLIESIGTKSSLHQQTFLKKIKDYEAIISYLEKGLNRFCSSDNYVFADERLFDAEIQEVVTRNSNFREIQATFKALLQKITHKLESQTLAEVQNMRNVLDLLVDKFKLREGEGEEIRSLSKQFTELSFKRDRKEIHLQLQRGKEIILDVLQKSESRDFISSGFESRGRVQSVDISEEKLKILHELLATLNGLAAEMIERSNQLKSIAERFSRIKETYTQDSEHQKLLSDTATRLFEKAMTNSSTGSIGLGDILYETTRRIKLVLSLNGDFNRDNPVKSLLRQIQTLWEKDDKFLSSLNEPIRDLEKKPGDYFESKDAPPLSTRRERKETVQRGPLVFNDFFEELLDIIKITRHYISGLEEKSLKNPSLTSIIDEPEIILNVLQDNLKTNESEFVENLRRLFNDYLKDKRQGSGSHVEESFFDRFRSLCLEKLQEEVLNVRNAYKLLDINLSLKNLVKNDGIEEVLRKKTRENNDKLFQVIGVEQKLLNYSALFNMGDRDQEIDPQTMYDAILTAYKEDPTHTRTSKRDKLQMQIYEMLREIGGFKIAFNLLLSLCTRYQKAFSDSTA